MGRTLTGRFVAKTGRRILVAVWVLPAARILWAVPCYPARDGLTDRSELLSTGSGLSTGRFPAKIDDSSKWLASVKQLSFKGSVGPYILDGK